MDNKDYSVSNGIISVKTYVQTYCGRSFVAYYGSKPCYEDDYNETDYTVEIESSDFIDWFSDKGWFFFLKDDNPDFFHLFYDDNDDWLYYNPTDEELITLLDYCVEHFKDRYGIDEFSEWAQERAQEAYDNDKY